MRLSIILILFVTMLSFTEVQAQEFITAQNGAGAFAVASSNAVAPVYVDPADYFLVVKSAALLQHDIEMVCDKKPVILNALPSSASGMIIVGSLTQSAVIKQLVREKKITVDGLDGKWETYKLQVVDNPFKGVDHALVIVGSDRRGTAYGVFELSKQMGVSPWYWWADVPVKKKKEIFIKKGGYLFGPPAVKYRGFFINDEAPAFAGWTKEKFGGVNHTVYEKVFELLLRMKANYLWPAMWGNAFNDDDTLNPVLADKYGIVMGTSHHEPMLRAQQEWKRYGKGPWDYETNQNVLKEFWKKGIENMGSHESIVSIGMRGDGDKPMTEGTAIALLEKIVKDQRKILEEVTGKNAAATPQLWALYKEVQDYYDKGMRVPDDVTLLLCDDNWGNLRKLPKPGEKARAGGYGIYYHFDYVGGPRNYKWLNTNPIPRIWEQMHLAYEHGVDKIWIVNIGDIKPLEFPTEFFLDYAWNPGRWPANRLDEYSRLWAEKQFGTPYAETIAHILSGYTKFNARRKPELLAPETYSLLNYREAETMVSEYKALEQKADSLYTLLPEAYKDAYYQLVLHPVQACSNLNDMYVTIAKNRLYAMQGRSETNLLADKARALFEMDSAISYHYNKIMAGGKWNHMMDQTHIGYTYWQQPPRDSMPEVKYIKLSPAPEMGVAIEGSAEWWPQEKSEAKTPESDPFQKQTHFIEIFNRGKSPFNYTINPVPSWLRILPLQGSIETEKRLWINVDWAHAPSGKQTIPLTIHGPSGSTVIVQVLINNNTSQHAMEAKGFVESGGYVSVEATHFSNAVETPSVKWQIIPGLSRTLSGITPSPVIAAAQTPVSKSPALEYEVFLFDTGTVNVMAYCSPTLDFNNTGGLRFAVSLDDATPQMLKLNEDESGRNWNHWVADNIIVTTSQHTIIKPGRHLLKFWMVDPGIVLQKLVIDAGGMKPSYLGPPESYYK